MAFTEDLDLFLDTAEIAVPVTAATYDPATQAAAFRTLTQTYVNAIGAAIP